MAFMQVEFYSEVLALASTIQVIAPERSSAGKEVPADGYPVLYLLHGGSDNHTSWHRFSSIERYAADKRVIVVMPSVQYSFYTDQKLGFPYFTYLSEELPAVVGHLFHGSGRREDTFVAGLSMGGYGAFKLGINCPEKFAAVASLSGSLDQRDRLGPTPSINNEMMLRMAHYTFGSMEEYSGSRNDLAHVLEEHLRTGVRLPKFYQACGTLDHNYEINQSFYRQFGGRLDLTCETAEGRGHEWDYWDEQIRRVLEWLPVRGGDLS
ncbi:alpha/beta hydrolase [Paenibacillus soyae]|uniref:Esterase family protein n=1 Tax=Paenibacillus soyae TaxID=2969249 RepID=A0A9X2MQP2_9BACL|nr:alpha/beta hydrolase family protein [Paenibacillus soyae]MCR2804645.1 esterase family protein [Paenibacillus soyae]